MPLTRDQLAVVAPPAGWVLSVRPTLRTAGYISIDLNQGLSAQNAGARLSALIQWAKDNGLGLKAQTIAPASLPGQLTYQYLVIGHHDARFPSLFKVSANHPEYTDETFGTWTCLCGRKTNRWDDPVCNECQRNYCENCALSFIKLHKASSDRGGDVLACAACSKPCTQKAGCDARILNEAKCHKCNPVFVCTLCFRRRDDDGTAVEVTDEGNAQWLRLRYERQYGSHLKKPPKVCGLCAAKHICKTCKKHDFTSPAAAGECALCADAKIEKERQKHETFPKDWVPKHGSLVIPSVAFRPFRTISYEMELDGDGDLVARTLYRCGLVPMSKVAGYHHHPNDQKPEYPCFMKHDGSVSAGEVIAYLLNLDDEKHAEALMDTCRKVNSLIQMKKASIGPRCGGHIHVDAHNYSYGDVWRLLTLFNYLEDPLYRIAGAGNPDGHRSLNPQNREHNGEGYTSSPVKGPFGTKGALGRSIQGQKRNSGLNFTPFISAAQMCECGSMAYEDSKNCKCNLGKATIEWRVFNSTANPRILHAWIALVQAMMAWSEGDADPTPAWERQYDAFPWEQRGFSVLAASKKETVRSRVEWMFRHLPLTDDERDSLAYAVEKSDIDMAGVDLRGIVPLNDFPQKKAPRNPARRKRALKLEPPTPGAPEGGYVDGRDMARPRARDPFRATQARIRAQWVNENAILEQPAQPDDGR